MPEETGSFNRREFARSALAIADRVGLDRGTLVTPTARGRRPADR